MSPIATNQGAGFTPGPWETTESALFDGLEVVSSDRQRLAYTGTNEANARLISAAPDLYDALEQMVAEKRDYMLLNSLGNPDDQHTIKVAQAALAKARGETA